jgi:hypothetical protein
MKYCVNCASQLEDGAAVCPNCGAAVPELEEQAEAAMTEEATTQPPKKQKTGIALVIGIPAAVVVIAVLAVLAFMLFSASPMLQFEKGCADFFASFSKLPANEVSTQMNARMAAEPHDVSMTMDLSNLSKLIPDAGPVPGDLTLKAGYKDNKTEGGFRLAVSTGGLDILKMAGLVADDKLLAGYSSLGMTDEIGVQAASLKLKGKPGDPFMDRLEGLYSTATQAQSQMIQDKLMKYLGESIDAKWFSIGSASITDGITGKTVNTKVAKLELASSDGVRFIETLSDKLDKDPDFYSTYDKMFGENATLPMNTREIFNGLFTQLSDGFKQGDFTLAVLVHFTGSTPVAIEVTLVAPDAEGNMDILLQKTAQGNSTAYVLSMLVSTGGVDDVNMRISLDVDSTDKGYSFDGKLNFDLGMAGSVSFGLKGAADIAKISSDEYSVDTKFNCNWNIPYSGNGDVDLELKEDVGFGSHVGSVKQDAGYMYSELSANAKEAATLEEFYTSLLSYLYGGIPGMY